jgi:hypothetical protein
MERDMAYGNRPNPFNPLIVGAIAVIVALAVFLIFREGDTTQQADLNTPPAATSPSTAPAPGPRGETRTPPTTNPPANQPAPRGPAKL